VAWVDGKGVFDATKPFNIANHFTRPQYPVDKIDLKKWFTEEQLAKIRVMQTDYGKTLAKTGW